MNERTPERRITDWIRSGPESAPPEFVEATLRPVPRMRQRRSWSVILERSASHLLGPAAVAIAVAVVGVGLALLGVGPGPGALAPTGPSFVLVIESAGSGRVDPALGTHRDAAHPDVSICTAASDGAWRYLYGGGDPHVIVDVLLVPRPPAPDEADVAATLVVGARRIEIDPLGLRFTSARDVGSATGSIVPGDRAMRLGVRASVPFADDRDGPPVGIELTIDCPR